MEDDGAKFIMQALVLWLAQDLMQLHRQAVVHTNFDDLNFGQVHP